MYLLDANVFITAKNLHYDFDVVPGFWDWIDSAASDGRVTSIDKVRDELYAQADRLEGWARGRHGMFRASNEKIVPALVRVATWARDYPTYTSAALTTFLASADYYLVAHALTFGDILVTHELPAPGSQKRVKIPEACVGVGVRYISPFTMLRQEHARFELA